MKWEGLRKTDEAKADYPKYKGKKPMPAQRINEAFTAKECSTLGRLEMLLIETKL